MVKVVSTDCLRDVLGGDLPPECYGESLDNPDGYFAHDVNPKEERRGQSTRKKPKGLAKDEVKD